MTVKEKIINALTLFWQNIKTKFVHVGNVVDNCASTSTTFPLSANQGMKLQNQIDELNSDMKNNYANAKLANVFTASQRVACNPTLDQSLYYNANLVLESNTSDTGAVASLGFHNGGQSGVALYLTGSRFYTIDNSGATHSIPYLDDVDYRVDNIKARNTLSVSWNTQGVNSGWAVGYYYPNLGFGFIQGGFSALALGSDLYLGTVTGSYTVSGDCSFPVSTGDNNGVGGYGTLNTRGGLVFKIPKSGVYAFSCFIY